MIRPDAIPVVPTGSAAVLDAAAIAALFGRGYALRGTERVRLVRAGRDGGMASAVAGPPALRLDALASDALGGTDGVRIVGPAGSIPAPSPTHVTAVLALPSGLRRAWGVPDAATVVLGTVAVRAEVAEAPEAAVRVDRALWLAAGRPATARWAASDTLLVPVPTVETAAERGVVEVARRVVTETDVRQARLRGERLRVRPGQVVTPAAQSLGRDLGVFAPEAPGGGR